jgi:uncharacterized membrane protein YjjB (DUF3815 family)
MTQILLSFAGSFCAGIIFNVRGRNVLWAGLSGAIGWMAFMLVRGFTGKQLIAIFTGAIAVGIFSEGAARIFKIPATVLSIPGIFPIVPGIAAYETIQYIVSGQLQYAGGRLVDTLAGAGAIAFGIMLVTAVFRLIFKRIKR